MRFGKQLGNIKFQSSTPWVWFLRKLFKEKLLQKVVQNPESVSFVNWFMTFYLKQKQFRVKSKSQTDTFFCYVYCVVGNILNPQPPENLINLCLLWQPQKNMKQLPPDPITWFFFSLLYLGQTLWPGIHIKCWWPAFSAPLFSWETQRYDPVLQSITIIF